MSDAPDPAEEAAPKAKNKLLPMIVIGNTLLLGGVAFLALKRPSAPAAAAAKEGEHEEKKEAKHEEEKKEEPAEEHGGGEGEHAAGPGGFSARFEGLVVQVHAEDSDRYAHLTFEIEAASDNDKKSIEARSARIRDAVITYLSDRAEDDLRGSTGIQQMKETIMKRVDEIVPGKKSRGIFITDFIIQ